MAKRKFRWWQPDHGDTESDANEVERYGDEQEAAEEAAEICHRESAGEWTGGTISVRAEGGDVKTFDVEMDWSPTFIARKASESSDA